MARPFGILFDTFLVCWRVALPTQSPAAQPQQHGPQRHPQRHVQAIGRQRLPPPPSLLQPAVIMDTLRRLRLELASLQQQPAHRRQYSCVYVPFIHAVVRSQMMVREVAAWASYDAEWNQLVAAYRSWLLVNRAPLMRAGALRRQVTNHRWPYISPAPQTDEPADATQPWPLRSPLVGVTQEGFLSQNTALFQRLMLMIVAWSAGGTVAERNAQAERAEAEAREAARLAAARAALPDVATAAAAAVVARARATQPPARQPRRLPGYAWDSSLSAECEQLVLSSPRPPRDQLRAIADDNQRRLAAGAFAFGASAVYTMPAQQLPPTPNQSPAALAVADCDTASAAIALYRRSPTAAPAAVLNYANAVQRGGGYVTGATAQEEDLCRVIPALYPALLQLSYPLDPLSVPATHAAICRLPASYAVSAVGTPVVVLTAAAPDLRTGVPAGAAAVAYAADMRRRIRAVLYAAHAAGCRDLVLGAWGCGVFRNDANAVASFFVEALLSVEWRFRFDNVVFAVPRGMRSTTHRIFSRTLDRLTRP